MSAPGASPVSSWPAGGRLLTGRSHGLSLACAEKKRALVVPSSSDHRSSWIRTPPYDFFNLNT